MKLYGGRFLRNSTARQVDRRTESRDAELYDIDYQNRRCRCKVQGTATLVVAHFPENWESTPAWLKPGNSVRISHTGGNRGRVELIGHGALVISPVAGDVGTLPKPTTNALLSGLRIRLTDIPSRRFLVTVGTIRINNIIYTIPPITMANGENYYMGDGGKMGEIAAAFPFPGYPSLGNYFYVCVDVGPDLVVHTTAGVQSNTPEFPPLAGDHVRGDWLLMDASFEYLAKNLDSSIVNATWTASVLAQCPITASDDDLAWGETTSTLTVTLRDQYGTAMYVVPAGGWCVKLEFVAGSGKITAPSGASTNLPTTRSVSVYTTSATVAFTYTRDNPATDSSPIIQATVIDYGASSIINLTLRDSGGNIM